jgi:hypothetical protein
LAHVIVAPIGENLESIYAAIRTFPTQSVYLVASGGGTRHAEKVAEVKKVLGNLKIPVHILETKGSLIEGMFRSFAQVRVAVGKDEDILVDVSSGDNMENCAALSASYVNGLKAFNVVMDKLMLLPVLKFSYYRLLPERKLAILRYLKDQPDCCASMEMLADRLKMSLPLLSYHINGSRDADGLVSHGLVEIREGPRGRTQVVLSELGRLIAEGFVEEPQTLNKPAG